jgi:hypothetical protein
MGVRRPANERFFPRYLSVSNAFVGTLRAGEGGPELDCKVIDVSRDGLGVLSNTPVDKNSVVELEVQDRKILLRVAYCLDDLIHKGRYRLGLHRTGSSENLVNLFSAAGFLVDK